MNNSFDTRYSEVKSVFENIAARVTCATFNETPETSTMCLKVMHKSALLEYFYRIVPRKIPCFNMVI